MAGRRSHHWSGISITSNSRIKPSWIESWIGSWGIECIDTRHLLPASTGLATWDRLLYRLVGWQWPEWGYLGIHPVKPPSGNRLEMTGGVWWAIGWRWWAIDTMTWLWALAMIGWLWPPGNDLLMTDLPAMKTGFYRWPPYLWQWPFGKDPKAMTVKDQLLDTLRLWLTRPPYYVGCLWHVVKVIPVCGNLGDISFLSGMARTRGLYNGGLFSLPVRKWVTCHNIKNRVH